MILRHIQHQGVVGARFQLDAAGRGGEGVIPLRHGGGIGEDADHHIARVAAGDVANGDRQPTQVGGAWRPHEPNPNIGHAVACGVGAGSEYDAYIVICTKHD